MEKLCSEKGRTACGYDHGTLTKLQAEHLEQIKRYSPQSSDSGGSSSGGGGGGSSGSGGGHSF